MIVKRISSGKYLLAIGDWKYRLVNHGYYPPDKCVWWEAVNLDTNEADFHGHTKREVIREIKFAYQKEKEN